LGVNDPARQAEKATMILNAGLRQQVLLVMVAGWLLLGVALGGCQEDAIVTKAVPLAGETPSNPVAVTLDSRALFFSTEKDAAFFSLTLPVASPARGYWFWAHPRPLGEINDQTVSVYSDPIFATPLCNGSGFRVESCFVSSTGGTVYAWVRESSFGQPGMTVLISAMSDAATGTAPIPGGTPQPLAAGQAYSGSISSAAPNDFAVTGAAPGLHQFKVTGATPPNLALFSDVAFSVPLNLPLGACASSVGINACLADAPAAGTVYVRVTTPSATPVSYSLSVIGP
jgi:hypothetical protein